jgi:predicted membrane protein
VDESERERQRQLARTVTSIQNMQLMLLVGLIAGGIVGVLLSAYVVIPYMGISGDWVSFFVVIPVCAFLGNRLVLWALSA